MKETINIREYLHEKNPYDGFFTDELPLNVVGFRLPESILRRVTDVKPRLVIEVGSWKGRSAIYMADLLKAANSDASILCVDTWLGAREMWKKPDRYDVPERYLGLALKNGYPSIYYDFLSNVVKSGHQDRITPFPNTSYIAGQLLREIGVKSEFIFIDGSHDFDDVLSDLRLYWDILAEGGILVGDDFDWGGVGAALRIFQREVAHAVIDVYDDHGWMIRKVTTNKSTFEPLKWKLLTLRRSRGPKIRQRGPR